MLEQRLENAFDEAQDKVLETYSRLTVEVGPPPSTPPLPKPTIISLAPSLVNLSHHIDISLNASI